MNAGERVIDVRFVNSAWLTAVHSQKLAFLRNQSCDPVQLLCFNKHCNMFSQQRTLVLVLLALVMAAEIHVKALQLPSK